MDSNSLSLFSYSFFFYRDRVCAILMRALAMKWTYTCAGMTFGIKYDGANEQFSPRCVFVRVHKGMVRFYLLRTVSPVWEFTFAEPVNKRDGKKRSRGIARCWCIKIIRWSSTYDRRWGGTMGWGQHVTRRWIKIAVGQRNVSHFIARTSDT